MDVGNFLQLQRTFECDGKGATAAEEKEVTGLRIFFREFLQRVVLRKNFFNLFSAKCFLIRNLQRTFVRQICAQPSGMNRGATYKR